MGRRRASPACASRSAPSWSTPCVEVIDRVQQVLAAAYAVEQRLGATRDPPLVAGAGRHPRAARRAGHAGLRHRDRATAACPTCSATSRAIERRLDRLAGNPARDRPAGWTRCTRCRRSTTSCSPRCRRPAGGRAAVRQIRWMIEELRVSLFAQALGTPYPVSEKRIYRAMDDAGAADRAGPGQRPKPRRSARVGGDRPSDRNAAHRVGQGLAAGLRGGRRPPGRVLPVPVERVGQPVARTRSAARSPARRGSCGSPASSAGPALCGPEPAGPDQSAPVSSRSARSSPGSSARCRRRCCRPHPARPLASTSAMARQWSSTCSHSRTSRPSPYRVMSCREQAGDEAGDDLLRVLVRAVVVGAPGDRHVQVVAYASRRGPPGRWRLGRRVRGVGLQRPLLGPGALADRAVHLVGRDVHDPADATARHAASSGCGP